MSKRSVFLLLLQFFCFGYFVFFQKLLAFGFMLGLQAIGFLLCSWSIAVMGIGNFNAQPEVKLRAQLVRRGPYSVIRNPMYTGLLLFFGASLGSSFTWTGLLVYCLLILTFSLKIKDEEKFLLERFGSDYAEYKSSTFRILPYML